MKRSRNQGELEQQVLEVLWSTEGPQTSTQILDALTAQTQQNGSGELALTTVLTVLTRLADKGLVEKTQQATGRGLLFAPTTTRERHTATQLLDLLERTGDPRLALSHFAKGLSAEAAAELKKLLD
jgi:predicted transcriptional regulator